MNIFPGQERPGRARPEEAARNGWGGYSAIYYGNVTVGGADSRTFFRKGNDEMTGLF